MADDGLCLPDDVLVNILLLLTPASSRRPLRLVCSRWRDLIDERAPPPPEERIPVRILVFVTQRGSSTALVFDDKDGRRAHMWTFTSSSVGSSVHMVGTCNGLLCLHDHSSYDGSTSSAVTVTNPITGEAVELPPVPVPPPQQATGHYSFGFHPETKQHKVVYIPRGRRRSSVDALRVFTLGGDTVAWREVPVPVPGACYGELPCEPVSVGGCTYWLAESAGRVMALDLKDERVTSVGVPPAMGPPAPILSAARASWRLTKVDGRLGVVVSASMPHQPSRRRVEVWVLEPEAMGGGDDGEKQKPRWSQRYCVADKTSKFWIMAPQLMHGDYVLSASQDGGRGTTQLYRHKVGDLMAGDGEIGQEPPVMAAQFISEQRLDCELTTFAYFETKNPVPRSKWPAREAE